MQLIDGKQIAQQVHAETRAAVEALKAKGITPGLAVVLVGDDPASRSYVRSKDKTSHDLGLHSVKHELPATTTQEELIALVHQLNADPAIHGILVQSPPPPHINEAAVIEAIDPRKDVDGFHPINVAKLALDDPSGFVPCTPLGCQRLLLASGIDPAGKHAVVIGRSMIVGKPMALLLMREGAVVIDVGINRVEDPTAVKGYRIVGDVAFDEVAPKCSAITPVPGGVGPMTIAMLMANTVKACRQLTGA